MTLPDCSVSPSDMQGQIDNIMTRLAGLEEAVAGLAASSVSAIQLSDISASVGWVYDVTYMGIPGWIQTAAGTLIPPPGFSISTESLFPNGAQTSGIGGGNFKWAQISITATANAITGIGEYIDTDSIVSVSSPTITITTPGLYVFALYDQLSISHTAAASGNLSVSDNSFGLPGSNTVCGAGQVISGSTGGLKFASIGSATITTIPSSNYNLTASATASAGTWNHAAVVSILKLS